MVGNGLLFLVIAAAAVLKLLLLLQAAAIVVCVRVWVLRHYLRYFFCLFSPIGLVTYKKYFLLFDCGR